MARPNSPTSSAFHFTAHMARHSLGTWLNEDGAGLRTIMEALGHADVHSSIRYQSADVEIVRAAINKVVHVYRSGKHYEVEFCLDNQSLTDAFSEDELELVDDRRKA
jgi:hypothetical protein